MTAPAPVRELRIGSSGPEVERFQRWAVKTFASYAHLLGSVDGYYGQSDAAFVRELQRRLGIVQDGRFSDRTASAAGYRWTGTTAPPVVAPRRPIWFYSAPGSGADWWLGPSFDVGEMVAGKAWNGPGRGSLAINHQPVGYPKGGYLGLMGGDRTLSYLEVIASQRVELARLLRDNPDVQRAMAARRVNPRASVDVELWLSGYSQSADGLCDAALALFGDGGEFELIHDRINGLICFGNPATPGTGIARKRYPAWLVGLMRNVNTSDDFYAVAPDAIRPAFYAEIVKAEMELPFFVHVLRIAVPIILDWAATLLPFIGPLLGNAGGFGPLVQSALSMVSGLGGATRNPAFGQLMGMAGTGTDIATTNAIRDILAPTGLLTNVPELIKLIAALPGLQSHGGYHATAPTRPEFADGHGPRTGVQVAYDIIARFTR